MVFERGVSGKVQTTTPKKIETPTQQQSNQRRGITPTPQTSYQKINEEINTSKAQIIKSKLPVQEKVQLIQQMTAQQQQVKEYEERGFVPKEIMLSGELQPGQMGPPAPVKGYEFTVPEKTQLDWARYQAEQSSKLPPGIREITQFGQGVVSSGLSVISPVADIIGKRKEFDVAATYQMGKGLSLTPSKQYMKGALEAGKYGIHYPSALDVAMEPIGLSPKGSTEFLKKNPAWAAGSIGGEIPQWIVGGEIIKAGSKVIKVGARVVVPKAINIFSKVTPTIERTIGKRLPSLAERLSETTIGKNVISFGKGYEPVAKGFERTVGSQSSRIIEGSTTITRIGREVKLVPKKWYGFAEREFVPSGTSKTLLKPSQEITMTMRPANKEASILFEKTGYKTGVRGTIRSYKSVDVVSRGGKTYVESGLKSSEGSLYNAQRGVSAPMTESEYVSFLKANPKADWYNFVKTTQQGSGIPSIARQTVKRTSGLGIRNLKMPDGTVIKGMGKGSSEASASLILQGPETRLVSTGGRTLRNLPSGLSVSLPLNTVETALGRTGAYAIARTMAHGQVHYRPPQTITIPKQEHETGFRPLSISSRRLGSHQVEIQLPMQGQRQQHIQTPDMIQERILRQETAKSFRNPSPTRHISTSKPWVPLWPMGFGGGSEGSGGYSPGHWYARKFSLIELKIPTMKDIFEGG